MKYSLNQRMEESKNLRMQKLKAGRARKEEIIIYFVEYKCTVVEA